MIRLGIPSNASTTEGIFERQSGLIAGVDHLPLRAIFNVLLVSLLES